MRSPSAGPPNREGSPRRGASPVASKAPFDVDRQGCRSGGHPQSGGTPGLRRGEVENCTGGERGATRGEGDGRDRRGAIRVVVQGGTVGVGTVRQLALARVLGVVPLGDGAKTKV